MDIVNVIRSLFSEILPEMVTILLITAPLFILFVFISQKTKKIIKSWPFLLPIQIIIFFLVTLSIKPLAISNDLIDIALLENASLTLVCFIFALCTDQLVTFYIWERAFVHKYDSPPPGIIMGLFSTLLYLLAIYGVMTFVFHQPITGLVVSSSIMVGVLGLSMQSSLSDLVAGVAISIERPFKIGEWIELDDGTLGKVVEINWRATHILSWHNSLYILPNARISNARVHNFNRPEPTYGHWFYVYVPSSVSPSLVRRVLLEACLKSSMVVVDPPPVIRISEGGRSYKYMVFVHFKHYPLLFKGVDDVLMNVWLECSKNGIRPASVTTELAIRDGLMSEVTTLSPQDLISQVPIFANLEDEDLNHLASKSILSTVSMDDAIVNQGDKGESLYIVSNGMAKVVVKPPGAAAYEVAKLMSGQYFGEQSLLANEARSATVFAHTECQLLEISVDALKPIFDSHPKLMEEMAEIVSERTLKNLEIGASQSKEDISFKLKELASALLGKMKLTFR